MDGMEKTFEDYKKLWEEKYKEGKIHEAMELINKANYLYPERYEAIYALIDCCKEGIRLFPDHMELRYLLSMCYLRLGKWDSPAIVAREALLLSPKDVRFYHIMAYTALIDFDYKRAVSIYEKVEEILPEEKYNCAFNKGFAFFTAGKIEEAEKIWREILEICPNDRRTLYSLQLLEKEKVK